MAAPAWDSEPTSSRSPRPQRAGRPGLPESGPAASSTETRKRVFVWLIRMQNLPCSRLFIVFYLSHFGRTVRALPGGVSVRLAAGSWPGPGRDVSHPRGCASGHLPRI